MFDLEKAIRDWRRQLVASGVNSRAVLKELESHLREEIERQSELGLKPKAAFEEAIQRMGDPACIHQEFAKVNGTSPLLRIFRVGSWFAAGLMLLSGTWMLWGDDLKLVERCLAQLCITGLAVYLAVLPFWYRDLPRPEKPLLSVIL